MTDNTHRVEDSVGTQKLSDRSVKALAIPQAGQSTLYDAELPGFGVRVTSTGTKSFVLRYRVKGVQKLITIGRYPTWTVVAARLRAQEFLRMAD
ncbi:MAG: Arm DNA-binding domain-containing protein, partial [Thermaurantiacus sp.]